jgi:diguanylate cyclase (GGDEF)-like protein
LRQAVEAAAAGDWGRTADLDVDADADADVRATADALRALASAVETRATELHRTTLEFYRALDRLGDVLGSTHDRAAIVDAVLETAVLLLRPAAAVFFVHAGPRRLRARAVSGSADASLELAVGEGIAGAAAASGEVVTCPASGIRPAEAERAAAGEGAVALPVRSGTRPFGVLALYGLPDDPSLLALYGLPDDPSSRPELDALRGLARQVATAIDNTYLYEEAARLSITDGLTGLWNRRQFDLRAAGELQRAVRFGESFGVVMLDIDHFKAVNDTHGHQAGDAVLVETARRLTEATRDVDVVARYGGEEFVLLLPNTTAEGAETLGAKLRERMEAALFAFDDQELRVTASVGFAAYPDHGKTVKELVAAADAGLYRAKKLGRNRVEAPPLSSAGGC